MALVPGCHCNALRSNTGLCHLPLPVVWSPKVGGGIAVVLQLVPTERNWAAGKRKVGRRERDGFPPVLAPGSARPRRKCFPPNSRLPTKCCSNLNKWEIFQKTNKVQRGNNSVYCHVFFDGQDLTNLMFLKNAHYKRLQPKILTLLKMELRRACDVNGSV